MLLLMTLYVQQSQHKMWHSLGVYPDLFESSFKAERRDETYETPQDDWHREIVDFIYPFVTVWANHHSTELRLPDGTIIIPKNCELVLFDNRLVEHRPPRRVGDNLVGRKFMIIRQC